VGYYSVKHLDFFEMLPSHRYLLMMAMVDVVS